MNIPAPGQFWAYKAVTYYVQQIHPDLLSQDPETGQWVATVTYQIPTNRLMSFARSVTEFARKFTPQ